MKKKEGQPKLEKGYSISNVARMLSVDRYTVYKWLSVKHPEDAVISLSGWYRLPGGHIRIRERAVLKLKQDLDE